MLSVGLQLTREVQASEVRWAVVKKVYTEPLIVIAMNPPTADKAIAKERDADLEQVAVHTKLGLYNVYIQVLFCACLLKTVALSG